MRRIFQIMIWIWVGLLCTDSVAGQKAERDRIREGNKYYNKEHFTEAEIAYRKGLEVNPRSFTGAYDLGNALYKQQKYPEAAEQYNLIAAQNARFIAENPENIERLAEVFHNLGNIGMATQNYAQSIEAYKQSLRLNPTDDETRYNLALAKKLLEEQEQNQDQNQEQEQEDEQQQDDQNQDQQPPSEDNQQQQEPPPSEEMSRENAEQILDTFLQDEKDTQEKVREQQQRQQERRRTEREW